MGAIADALAAIKDVLRMRDDLDRLRHNIDKLASATDDLDRRMVRIETIVEFAGRPAAPKRLK